MADLKTLGMREPLQQPIHLSQQESEFLRLLAGNQKITNYVFKDPTKPVEPPKPPKLGLGTAPPNTKLGIGTGEKDEKGGSKSSAKSKAEQEAKERQRQAEQAAKALADIRYKYASEEKKVALDLQKALDEIEKSKMTADEKPLQKSKPKRMLQTRSLLFV